MTAVHPGANNTFVQHPEASGNLAVGFARDPKTFAYARYAQIIPATKTSGLYMELTTEEAGRADLNRSRWAPGSDSPDHGDTEKFEFKEFACQRYAEQTKLPIEAVQQADFKVDAIQMQVAAQKLVTGRTMEIVTAMTADANYDSSHILTCGSGGDITGMTGSMVASTAARGDIKRALETGAELIRKATLGAVKLEDLRFVISPEFARKLGGSNEITEFIKGSPDAKDYIFGKLGANSYYNLPAKLYGIEVVVEDAVKVTSARGATKVTADVMPEATPVLIARPGSLVGLEGAPSFATVALFVWKDSDMLVESREDSWHRKWEGRVTDWRQAKVIAPISGIKYKSAS